MLLSCHDAPRTNPFDPVLTPPVELQVALDDTSGTATLTWTRYDGKQPFEEYRVLRNQIGLTRVDTLVHLTSAEQTTFVDTTLALDTDYEYWVSAVNTGGFSAPSEKVGARPLSLPAVELLEPSFDSRTATAALQWAPYRGPHFRAYRVERRTAGLTPQVVAALADLTSTTYVDTGLVGNTEYFYRVVVETERDEAVPSKEQSGIFHQLLDTWSLAITEGEYVRLYLEGEGITALTASSSQVRLFFFNTQGTLLAEQVLLDNPDLNINPRSVTTSLGLGGQRFLGLNTGRNTATNWVSVWRYDAIGESVVQKTPVFADTLGRLSGDYTTVQGRIFLDGLGSSVKTISFDNVVVSRSGQVLFAEDFEEGGLGEWDYRGAGAVVAEGKLISNPTVTIAKTDASWQDFSLEADVVLSGSGGFSTDIKAGIGMGNIGTAKVGASSYFGLFLNQGLKGVVLQWRFTPPEGSGLERQTKSLSEPFPFLTNVPYRLGLDAEAGEVHAWVSSPVFWHSKPDEDSPWASLAGIGEIMVFTAGRQSYRINSTQALESGSLLQSEVSEVRIWETSGTPAQHWMGMCLPEKQLPAIVKTAISPRGYLTGIPSLESLDGTVRTLGIGVGQNAGAFLFPLSLDGSPDGRIYVLDAGNARIQVFDIVGKYLTQWGRKGSGEGEFDFGRGRVPEDFAGSVAVDSEGYIYVADVGNQRIQKFAP